MKNIDEVLTELNPNLLSDIRGYFWSINKLATSSTEFKSLLKQYPELSNATYILNPNINNSNGSIFLDSTGKIVFTASFFANLLKQIELDFNIESPDLTKNHPLEQILESDFQF
jgi:hypothetical protein